jgi:hypothetical protein
MNAGCIYNIDLITNNKETYSVSSDDFNHFYIANINDDGDEINYNIINDVNSLFANFFMIKIINNDSKAINQIIKNIEDKNNITKVGINFTSGKYQEFDLPKQRIASNGKLINKLERNFYDEKNNLCIVISDKNIKYMKELFE